MSLNWMSGVLVAAFGLILIGYIIPTQVEAVDYGWVRPETLPNAMAVALVVLGLLHAFTGADPIDLRGAPRAFLYLGFTAAAVWAMGRIGFVAVAPVAMLALMLLIGERRPLWLGIGAIAFPAAIWLVVVPLLGRTLPG